MSGRSRSMIWIASAPDAAASTWSPRPSSAFSTTFLTLRLSSTTRTFCIGLLLRNGCGGRVGPALVNVGGGAQQKLLQVPVNRLHARGGRGVERIEREVAVRLAVRRDEERLERRLTDEAEEFRVDDASAIEEHGAAACRQRHDELAGLPAERDRLGDVGKLHHRQRPAQAVSDFGLRRGRRLASRKRRRLAT